MTQPNGMPENPGDPEQTDPEATSADRAEAAAEEASKAQADAVKDENFEAAADGEAQFSPELDPEVEVEIEETLSNVDPDADGDGEVSDIEAQLAERTEDLQRLNAEYTNYRRRTERDRQAVIEAAKSQVLAALLPILDDLELARQHGDLKDSPLKAIADKLTSTLEGQQLEAFGAEGDAFDPEIHEAVQDLSSGGEQVVGTVLRRGYRVGDKLVRNAMVIIADPESSESES
ncbi:nucleotide exchange factor GrpE [Corynebacterium casei]|uniref:nucleotide exchange factor GrpE n=1 Tax=Corynebacterium casei TaxID=160386 RepID=UPI0009D1FE9C|nr:nucleotide exchange factor GrpE [Corynebacterium casei]MDN5705552.1 nucleotide exchange factor GrpE [Corynebacterium casei]MDN5728381.1 nucleotide exchange factor GrpE [Corynebacterium casei]MDN5739853.1 nucleotide exchange factor GrpE [Corynebacterium casei]MDN5783754.1 nucleotide exchange factor GrpE [Corynebacterium casei]MDN5799351.1 nucleotide exchange factor GrpE [Corynebacterium casei]